MKVTTTIQIDADVKALAKAKKIRLGEAAEAGIKAALEAKDVLLNEVKEPASKEEIQEKTINGELPENK